MGRKPKIELTEEQKLERANNWRKRTVKYTDGTAKVSEIERVILSNDKFDDVTVWAMQAHCIDPNPIMFYKATHQVKDSETMASLSKKANAFLTTPTMQAALKAMKKDIASKSFVPASIRRRVMLEKEVDNIQRMVEDNSLFEDVHRDEAIKAFVRRVRLNPDDTEAWNWLTAVKGWKNQEDINEEDIYGKLLHFCITLSCNLCERKGTVLCSGCSIEKQEDGLLTEEELRIAEELESQ